MQDVCVTNSKLIAYSANWLVIGRLGDYFQISIGEIENIMFDYRHYVPILRWKRAEWVALGSLYEEDKAGITPLIELTPNRFSGLNKGELLKKLAQTVIDVDKNWGEAPFFIDCGLLPFANLSLIGQHPLEILCKAASVLNLTLIPVIGLNTILSPENTLVTTIKENGFGVCIRLHRNDIQSPNFNANLQRMLTILVLCHFVWVN